MKSTIKFLLAIVLATIIGFSMIGCGGSSGSSDIIGSGDIIDIGDIGDIGDTGDIGDIGDIGDNGDSGDIGDNGDITNIGDNGDISNNGDNGDINQPSTLIITGLPAEYNNLFVEGWGTLNGGTVMLIFRESDKGGGDVTAAKVKNNKAIFRVYVFDISRWLYTGNGTIDSGEAKFSLFTDQPIKDTPPEFILTNNEPITFNNGSAEVPFGKFEEIMGYAPILKSSVEVTSRKSKEVQ